MVPWNSWHLLHGASSCSLGAQEVPGASVLGGGWCKAEVLLGPQGCHQPSSHKSLAVGVMQGCPRVFSAGVMCERQKWQFQEQSWIPSLWKGNMKALSSQTPRSDSECWPTKLLGQNLGRSKARYYGSSCFMSWGRARAPPESWESTLLAALLGTALGHVATSEMETLREGQKGIFIIFLSLFFYYFKAENSCWINIYILLFFFLSLDKLQPSKDFNAGDPFPISSPKLCMGSEAGVFPLFGEDQPPHHCHCHAARP